MTANALRCLPEKEAIDAGRDLFREFCSYLLGNDEFDAQCGAPSLPVAHARSFRRQP